MPKGATLPCIVLSRVATSDIYTLQGPAGFRNALFQLDCYGSSYYSSRALAEAVRRILGSFAGNLPDTDATAVAEVLTTKDWDMHYEEGAKGFVYRSMLEFRVWYYEGALPTAISTGTGVVSGGSFTSTDTGNMDGGSF